jgi:RNA polymerase sigma-70 factor
LSSHSEHPRAPHIGEALAARLFVDARAGEWCLSPGAFTAHLESCVRHAFPDADVDEASLERFLASLHLPDLALACACAEGIDTAWDHFVREYRPVLYRAADAIDPSGGAREQADSLYAELFGLRTQDGERRSHFRYFHGRSSLATWLRAVLSQRHVDRVRRDGRVVPLPDDEAATPLTAPTGPGIVALRYLELMRRLVLAAVAALAPRDRLRLRCYYAQDLTLAQIGTLLREHEATVSRHLARSRRAIRADVEAALRTQERMTEGEVAECFAAVLQDAGPLDIGELLAEPADADPTRARSSGRIVQGRERERS